jgi:hypothetical protein
VRKAGDEKFFHRDEFFIWFCHCAPHLMTLSALTSTFGGIPQHRGVEVGRVGRLFIASSFNRPSRTQLPRSRIGHWL